jgi:cell wall-associated NlpC family hydrolase
LVLRKRPGRHRPFGRTLTVASSLILASLAPALPGAPALGAPNDTIESKAAEAKRLEAAIAENGRRISQLDEDYNEARYRIEEATAGLADAQARIDAAQQHRDRLQSQLAGRAAALYTQAGSRSPLAEFDADSIRDLGSYSRYSEAAAEHDDALLAQLDAARELLGERQDELEAAREAAEAEQAALDARREEIEGAQAEQEELLSQVQGELAQLVRAEQRRREREAAAAARAEFEERAARERAAREASATDGGGSGEGTTTAAPSTPAPNVPAPSGGAQAAIDTAKAQLGKPYVYAAAGPDTFDCSGLTMYAWAAAGVSLPHSSRMQFAALPHVPMEAMAPGDLVFYGNPIHHVGMYLGDGVYIHAPQTGDVVKISSVYRDDFAGAARPG